MLNVLDRASAASDFIEYVIFTVSPLLIELLFASVYLSSVHGWPLLCVICTTAAAYLGISLYLRDAGIAYGTQVNERSDLVASNKNDAISNVELIQYFGAEVVSFAQITRLCLTDNWL